VCLGRPETWSPANQPSFARARDQTSCNRPVGLGGFFWGEGMVNGKWGSGEEEVEAAEAVAWR